MKLTDAVVQIFTVASTIVGFIIASRPLLSNFIGRVSGPLDIPSVQLVSVTRYPIDVKSWKKVKANVVLFLLSFVLTPPALILLINLPYSASSSIDLATIIILLLLLVISIGYFLYILYFFRIIFMRQKTVADRAYGQRYILFKDVDIIVNSTYDYLFNKCHNSLKRMNLSIMELDKAKGFIETYHQGWLWRSAGHTTIQVTSIENTENMYLIKVKFTMLPKNTENFSRNSLITNRFINELITKPKDGDEKPQE